MHYWTYNLIERRVPQSSPFMFSDPDLSALTNLCFIHKNLYCPVFHRPTFERSIRRGTDIAFGAAVLLVCPIGSRFSDDARVSTPEAERPRRGWELFYQLLFHRDHLFEPPTIYRLQYYCRATFFLEYYALRRVSK
ncbi:hypothetical protein C8R44DRAFT_883536 [Mycena epipterygia]|nr:hypothetical protein C8R44DRAFT_883536 [Mycena epipterygia]